MKRSRQKDIAIDTALPADLYLDLHDYRMPIERRSLPRRKREWNPTVIVDWPERSQMFEREVDVLEALLGEEFDRILANLRGSHTGDGEAPSL